MHSSLTISLGFYRDQLLCLHLNDEERREPHQETSAAEKYIGDVGWAGLTVEVPQKHWLSRVVYKPSRSNR